MNDEILAHYSYNPETGILLKKGKVIGHKSNCGYITTSLYGNTVQIARIIWLLMTGEYPDTIDHINRNRTDNRWDNLRSVSQSENNFNRKMKSTNRSGVTGVCRQSKTGLWIAYFSREYLGCSYDWFEVVSMRKSAENRKFIS